MARATAATIAERVEILQQKILEGASNTVCIAYARREWGVSRAQGYRSGFWGFQSGAILGAISGFRWR